MAAATKLKVTETTTEDLAAQVEALKSDLAALTGTLADYGKTQGAHLKEGAKARAVSARESGEAQIEHLRAQGAELGKQAESFVQEKPAVSVGIAAGLGFVAGLFLARK
ncbi:MAG: DUF883 family protein [Paracoccaceae bacterium]